uniref:Uncharacterized protein n=1 Tax=Arundo donax TaxID=35708 RepID=A0A0A9EB34_ARUDO
MELAGQITHRVVHMVRRVQAEGRTILKGVLAISSSMGTGNNMASNVMILECPSSWTKVKTVNRHSTGHPSSNYML